MKKIRFLSMLLTLAIMFGVFVFPALANQAANQDTKVLLNGTELSFDVTPQVADGRTLIPLRAVAKELNTAVNRDETTNTVTLILSGSAEQETERGRRTDNGPLSRFQDLTTTQLAEIFKHENAFDLHGIMPLIVDENVMYCLVYGWFGAHIGAIDWRELVFPVCLETHEIKPPVFQIDHSVLAAQTGVSQGDTFWIATFPIGDELFFIEFGKDGTLLRSVAISAETLHGLPGDRDLQQEVSFSRNAFHFAVMERGIVIQYFRWDGRAHTTTLGILTLEGELQKIELPGQFTNFILKDNHSNGLYIYPWLSEELGYPSHYLYRLDGSTLQWSQVLNEETPPDFVVTACDTKDGIQHVNGTPEAPEHAPGFESVVPYTTGSNQEWALSALSQLGNSAEKIRLYNFFLRAHTYLMIYDKNDYVEEYEFVRNLWLDFLEKYHVEDIRLMLDDENWTIDIWYPLNEPFRLTQDEFLVVYWYFRDANPQFFLNKIAPVTMRCDLGLTPGISVSAFWAFAERRQETYNNIQKMFDDFVAQMSRYVDINNNVRVLMYLHEYMARIDTDNFDEGYVTREETDMRQTILGFFSEKRQTTFVGHDLAMIYLMNRLGITPIEQGGPVILHSKYGETLDRSLAAGLFLFSKAMRNN